MTVRFYKDGKLVISYIFVLSIFIDPFGNVTLKHMQKAGKENIVGFDFEDYDELKFIRK